MKGDFSRLLANDTYIMTLMQQGRVQLDSDWNAQVVQQWMYLKAMTATILGEHGGPADEETQPDESPIGEILIPRGHFKVLEKTSASELDFTVCEGRYFVDGDMCLNRRDCSYLDQPYLPAPFPQLEGLGSSEAALVYLRVWMRHVTHIEDPLIREVALRGPDTTTRVQRVWQVITVPAVPPPEFIGDNEEIEFEEWAEAVKNDYGQFQSRLPVEERSRSGHLKAYVERQEDPDDPCVLPPEAGYRGVENQLYRVEILYPGDASPPPDDIEGNQNGGDPPEGKAVLVWSRDNGSVVYPIEDPQGELVTLKALWRDDRYAIHVGDWVEISDEVSVLQRTSLPLRRVVAVDTEVMQITLSGVPSWGDRQLSDLPLRNPIVRRWDHAGDPAWGGGIPVVESTEGDEHPIALEKGIYITFWANEDTPYQYHKNDWWLIPARTATGDIEWPPSDEDPSEPKACEPMQDGFWHAPLALLQLDGSGNIVAGGVHDTRRQFHKIWQEIPSGS